MLPERASALVVPTAMLSPAVALRVDVAMSPSTVTVPFTSRSTTPLVLVNEHVDARTSVDCEDASAAATVSAVVVTGHASTVLLSAITDVATISPARVMSWPLMCTSLPSILLELDSAT
jgi:hypothetical protein